MSKTIPGLALVAAWAAAGIAAAAILYSIVIGLYLAAGVAPAGNVASVWQGAWSFGATFGLLSGAHWALSSATARLGGDRGAMLVVKAVLVALVVLALVLTLTGGRWSAMFGDLRGPAAVLVVAWIVMTHVVSKALEKRTPARNPAGV